MFFLATHVEKHPALLDERVDLMWVHDVDSDGYGARLSSIGTELARPTAEVREGR